MVTPLGKLTDLPTFKEKVRQQPHNVNYGLVGYPVLMTADIVLYKTDIVPVGVDQAPHIEFARETVRSFNYRYNTNVLIEPQMKATEVPKVIGIDGQQKMSKSLNNHIELAATPEETTAAGDADGHRPAAHAPHRPRQPGRVQRVLDAQDLFDARGSRRWSTSSAAGRALAAWTARQLLAAQPELPTWRPSAPGGPRLAETRTTCGTSCAMAQQRARRIARQTMGEVRACHRPATGT